MHCEPQEYRGPSLQLPLGLHLVVSAGTPGGPFKDLSEA